MSDDYLSKAEPATPIEVCGVFMCEGYIINKLYI